MKIIQINRRKKIAVTDTYEIVDFDMMYDIDGCHTDDPEACVVATVRLPNGLLDVVKLGDFEKLGTTQ